VLKTRAKVFWLVAPASWAGSSIKLLFIELSSGQLAEHHEFASESCIGRGEVVAKLFVPKGLNERRQAIYCLA
jgi:hypothetical protein